MNNKEKIKFLEGVEDYYEKKQLFELFENLVKKLLVKKPDNPLDFLIQQLENPTDKRIFFTVGLNWAKYRGLLDELGKQFGLKVVSTKEDSLFTGDDNHINEQMHKEMTNLDSKYKGLITFNYPSNLNQSLFVQEKGIIAEKFFVFENLLENDELNFFQEYVNAVMKKEQPLEVVKNLFFFYRRNIEDIKEAFKDLFTALDYSGRTQNDLFEKIKKILMPRNRKKIPLRLPRILIIRPSGLSKLEEKLTMTISNNFDLNNVSMNNLLQSEISKKTEIGLHSFKKIKSKEPIPDDIMCALGMHGINLPASKHKGWVLSGFPKTINQLEKFIQINMIPHVIIVLNESNVSLFNRIRPSEKNYEDRQTKIIVENYERLVEKVKEHYKDKVIVYPPDPEKFDSIVQDCYSKLIGPKFYS